MNVDKIQEAETNNTYQTPVRRIFEIGSLNETVIADRDEFHAPYCERCSRNLAVKTDSSGLPVCHRCSNSFTGRVKGKSVLVGRNDPCPCGSTKKYKACCRATCATVLPTPR